MWSSDVRRRAVILPPSRNVFLPRRHQGTKVYFLPPRHEGTKDFFATKAQRHEGFYCHEGTKDFIATKARRHEGFYCHEDTKARRILWHEGTKEILLP
jgi:hypothetical protein